MHNDNVQFVYDIVTYYSFVLYILLLLFSCLVLFVTMQIGTLKKQFHLIYCNSANFSNSLQINKLISYNNAMLFIHIHVIICQFFFYRILQKSKCLHTTDLSI